VGNMPQITAQLVLSTSFTIDSLEHRAIKPELRTVSLNKQPSKIVPVHTTKTIQVTQRYSSTHS